MNVYDNPFLKNRYIGFLREIDTIIGQPARVHLQHYRSLLADFRAGKTPREAIGLAVHAYEAATRPISGDVEREGIVSWSLH